MSTKKRNRATKVCDFCRRRKVKCDLGNPCSTCVKYGHRNCRYKEQDNEADSDFKVQDQLLQLKEKLRLLEESVNQNPAFSEYHKEKSSISSSSSSSSNINNYNSNRNISSNNSVNNSSSVNSKINNNLNNNLSNLNINNNPNSINVNDNLNINNEDVNFNSNITNNNKRQHLAASSSPPFENPGFGILDVRSVLGRNPVASEEDVINFYDGYSSVYDKEPIRRRNFGPMAWVTLVKVDNCSGKLWDYIHCVKNSNKEIRGAKFNGEMLSKVDVFPTANAVDQDFREKVTEDEGFNEVRPYKDVAYKLSPGHNKSSIDNKHSQNTLNEKAKSLGLMFYQGGLDEELALIEKIRLVLPKRKVIWLLYKRYFTHLYLALPLLDEVVFKEKIQKLVGQESYEDVDVKVQVEMRLDFAQLGLLLIVLRLSYLTLFTNVASINEANLILNDPSPRAQEIKYLLNNPINIDVIDVAQSCLNQFNLMKNVNMTTMQLAMYMRIYHMYAPEEGDGIDGGDAQVFNAMLIQMAYSLGLHREPDKFPKELNDEKTNNLGRKMWYMLLVFDMNNCMANGTPMNVHRLSFDTVFPFYRPGNENVIDVEVEKSVLSSFNRFNNVYAPMTEILDMIVKVKGGVKMTDLAEKLSYMESHFVEEYGKIGNHFDAGNLSQVEVYQTTLKVKIHLTSNMFVVTIFFHIFNYYEKKGFSELAFFYLKKIFLITILDLMPFYFEFLDRSHIIFKNSTDLSITPAFEMVTHKALIVLMSILLRVRFAIKTSEDSFDHNMKLIKVISYKIYYDCLIRIKGLLEKCLGVFRESIAKLSHRYYYSWRITKAQNFLNTLLTSDQLYETYAPRMSGPRLEFTNAMLEELTTILEKALYKVKEHKKAQKGGSQASKADPTVKRDPASYTVSGSVGLSDDRCNSYEDRDKITPTFSSTSVGSTTSNDNYFDGDYLPNDQIDSIWLQMMSLKSQAADPTANFNTPAPLGVGIPGSSMYDALGTPGASLGGDMGPYLETDNLNLYQRDDFFGNMPLEEIFKDFS